MNVYRKTFFKICPMCHNVWITRDDFLDDQTLVFIGYQANFNILERGLFYFTHESAECGSTMVIEAQEFLTLYTGSRYAESKQLSKECPGYCLDRDQRQRCPASCHNAFVREVTQIIMDRSHKDQKLQGNPANK